MSWNQTDACVCVCLCVCLLVCVCVGAHLKLMYNETQMNYKSIQIDLDLF